MHQGAVPMTWPNYLKYPAALADPDYPNHPDGFRVVRIGNTVEAPEPNLFWFHGKRGLEHRDIAFEYSGEKTATYDPVDMWESAYRAWNNALGR